MCCILMEWKSMHIHYNDLYGHTLEQEPLARGHEIYNFVKPFVSHQYYALSLSKSCPKVEKRILKETMIFTP